MKLGPDAMIFVFWMLSFKPNFSLSSITFTKRLFNSSSLSAIWTREAWHAAVMGLQTEQLNWSEVLWIVPVSKGDHVVVTDNVHKRAARFFHALWFLVARRFLGQVGFLDFQIKWNETWANRKGLESHHFFPLKPHTHTVSRLTPSGSTVHCWGCLGARRLRSGRRLGLGPPAPGEVGASWILPWNSSGPRCHVDSCPSQTEHTVDLSKGFSEGFPARLYRPHPDSAVGPKPAQPPGMG